MKFIPFLTQDNANFVIPIVFAFFSILGFAQWQDLADNHWLVPIGWQVLLIGTPILWFRNRYKTWKKLYKS